MLFTFEGQPAGSTGGTSVYTESGMRFLDPSGPQQLVRNGGGLDWAPDDGTAYLQSISGGIGFSFNNFPGTYFNFVSFDAAGYSTNQPGPVSLEVVGYKGMAGTVTNYFTVSSFLDRRASSLPDFETFYLDSLFQGVSRVDVLADWWSLDNVLISGVPEPSGGRLLLLGTLFGLGPRWVRGRRSLRGCPAPAND